MSKPRQPNSDAHDADSISQKAFRFLQDIATDLSSGEVVFPTFLDATLQIRSAMKNPDLTVEELAHVVSAEPLVSLRVLRLANSVAHNPTGKATGDVKSAVIRLGFAQVRTQAVAVAMEQLLKSKDMAPFIDLARALWEHSIQVAATSFVIARKLAPKLNPDEAMFAGLVHDIGQFYLLSRAGKYPELVNAKSDMGALMMDWHAQIGHALLTTLDTPEQIVSAVDDHETYGGEMPPRTLAEVVFVANLMATKTNPFADAHERMTPETREAVLKDIDEARVAEILSESKDEVKSLLAALRG